MLLSPVSAGFLRSAHRMERVMASAVHRNNGALCLHTPAIRTLMLCLEHNESCVNAVHTKR
jgi:hypothetical protein